MAMALFVKLWQPKVSEKKSDGSLKGNYALQTYLIIKLEICVVFVEWNV